MSEDAIVPKRQQYTPGFLAGSFGLTDAQARNIIAEAGEDRARAAELAKLQKARNN